MRLSDSEIMVKESEMKLKEVSKELQGNGQLTTYEIFQKGKKIENRKLVVRIGMVQSLVYVSDLDGNIDNHVQGRTSTFDLRSEVLDVLANEIR